MPRNLEYIPYAETPLRKGGLPPELATELAAATAIATSTEQQFEAYQAAYTEAGRSREWDAFEFIYQNARDKEAQARVFANIRERSAELGIQPSPDGDLPTVDSPVLMDEFTAAVASSRVARDVPHLAAMMEKAAQTPPGPNADRADLDSRYNSLLELDRRIVEEAETAKANRDFVNEHIARTTVTDNGWQMAGNILYELAPTESIVWGKLAADMLDKGAAPGAHWLPGEAAQMLRETYVGLSPDDKKKFVRDILTWFRDHPNLMTDFKEIAALNSVLNENVLATRNPDDIADRWIGNLAGALDLFVVGDLIRIFKSLRFGTLGRATRALNRVSPQRAQQYMAELFDRVSRSNLAQSWGVSKETIAVSQLPKPRLALGSGDHIPDGVIEEAVRVGAIRKDLGDMAGRARAVLYTPEEATTAFERVAGEIERAVRPRIRPALSSVRLHEDGGGVDFFTVLGRTNTDGFVTLRAAQQIATRYANLSDEAPRLLRVGKNGELEEVPAGLKPQARGTYYVELRQTALLRPEDKLLFGDSPVLNNAWLGASGRYLLTPAAQFDPKIYRPYVTGVLKEAAITTKLDQITAPLFRDLNAEQRVFVGQMWEWTEEFGRTQGRLPTFDELRQTFPDSTANHLRGWFQARMFYDTVYAINNERLYREWFSRGFKSARKGTTQIHGEPLAESAARRVVFDPETQTSRTLTSREVADLYARGGVIMRTDLPVSAHNRKFHRFVVVDPATGWNLAKLSQNPLRYIPGYYPRIYEDFIFVERVVKNAEVDGVAGAHRAAIGVAATRKEAQEFIERMRANNADPEIDWEIADDARLRGKDRTAMDLERMQLEGRLFFDERNARKLYDIHGNVAEVVDPINMLRRTSRMVGRQVAVEDLVRTMKASWGRTYADMLKGDFAHLTSSAVDAELRSMVNAAGAPVVARAREARAWWDYIRFMEGSTGEASTWFRRRAIAAAEFLNEQFGGVPAIRRLTTFAVRNAHNFTPVEWMKRLAYFDFLVTRPFRQLLLQGSQHLFLQALAPTYAGRWQLDTIWLMQGAKRRAIEAAGGKTLRNKLLHRNAKLMGLKVPEYERLIEEFEKSGLMQAVDIHSIAGDLPRSALVTHETATGRLADRIGGTLTARPIRHAAEKYGFNLGEQYNVSASYLMALRLFREKRSIKDLTKMTTEQWEAVARRGSDLALAMHRANASRYQYGLASLPLQFLQFSHKALLVGLRAASFGRFGNRAFTVGEAWKIVAGQALLFGLGAGFGIKPEVEKALAESGFGELVGTEVSDLVAGGLLDYILDKSLQKLADDPELDLAFDEFLAPGANVVNITRKFIDAAFEMPVSEVLTGPSGVTLGRIAEAAHLAQMIAAVDLSQYTPAQESRIVAEAFLSGIASGYNDFVKARAAHKQGIWISQSGEPTAIEATWATVVAQGLLGLPPQARYDSFALTSDQKKYEAELKAAARTYYQRVKRLLNVWGEGSANKEHLLAQLELEQWVLHSLEPEERDFVHAQILQEMRRDEGAPDSISLVIAKSLTRGVPPDKALRAKIATTTSITDETQRAALLQMIDQWFAEVEPSAQIRDEYLKRQLELVRNADAD